MSDVIPFDFEGAAVRVVTRDGAPWFVLADVCRVLGLVNVGQTAARLDDDEKDDIRTADVTGREQPTTAISESGFYALVLTSRKEAAKRFKKWVTAEVLPSIRQRGGYRASPPAAEVPVIAQGRLATTLDWAPGVEKERRYAVSVLFLCKNPSAGTDVWADVYVIGARDFNVAIGLAAIKAKKASPLAELTQIEAVEIPD